MNIKLAGFNVDVENINTLQEALLKDGLTGDDLVAIREMEWTPESISASYARISRDERDIAQLRNEARKEIKKTRKSNDMIIFEMGHSSIAEHGVFNLDLVDISRIASEHIEKSRLASYTEKSQRYVKISSNQYIPDVIADDSKYSDKYKKVIDELFDGYNHIHDKLVPYFTEKFNADPTNKRDYRDIVNLAKEDARYLLPLCAKTQLGMTINARSLEKMLRKLNSSPLKELNLIGEAIYDEVYRYAPSLIKYTKPSEYERDTYSGIRNILPDIKENASLTEVDLIEFDSIIINKIIAGFIVKTKGADYRSALEFTGSMDDNLKRRIMRESILKLNSYDALLKEYEMSDFVFNILISSTGFAQLKRHRMASVIDGDYNPMYGVKIPDSIVENGLDRYFLNKIAIVNELYYELKEKYGQTADYVLTNAHRKNVIFKCNFRELTHFSRLRSDKHAQWDIRNISDLMIKSVSEKVDFVGDLLSGKDSFNTTINKVINLIV